MSFDDYQTYKYNDFFHRYFIRNAWPQEFVAERGVTMYKF